MDRPPPTLTVHEYPGADVLREALRHWTVQHAGWGDAVQRSHPQIIALLIAAYGHCSFRHDEIVEWARWELEQGRSGDALSRVAGCAACGLGGETLVRWALPRALADVGVAPPDTADMLREYVLGIAGRIAADDADPLATAERLAAASRHWCDLMSCPAPAEIADFESLARGIHPQTLELLTERQAWVATVRAAAARLLAACPTTAEPG